MTDHEQQTEIHLGEEQLEEHGTTAVALQRANCMAAQLLLKLHWCEPGGHEDRQIRIQILGLAVWMNFWMAECERIITERDPTDLVINIHVQTYCARCWENGRAFRRASPTNGTGLIWSDESWAHQARLLLRQTNQAAKYTFLRDVSRSQCGRIPECLLKLGAAVRRQIRHLQLLGAKQPQINVQTLSGVCAVCGGPATFSRTECSDEAQ